MEVVRSMMAAAALWLFIYGGCGGPAVHPRFRCGERRRHDQEPLPLDLNTEVADPDVLKAAPEWQLPLMPAFEQAAAAYEVPLDLLLTLAKIGSGLENRGTIPPSRAATA